MCMGTDYIVCTFLWLEWVCRHVVMFLCVGKSWNNLTGDMTGTIQFVMIFIHQGSYCTVLPTRIVHHPAAARDSWLKVRTPLTRSDRGTRPSRCPMCAHQIQLRLTADGCVTGSQQAVPFFLIRYHNVHTSSLPAWNIHVAIKNNKANQEQIAWKIKETQLNLMNTCTRIDKSTWNYVSFGGYSELISHCNSFKAYLVLIMLSFARHWRPSSPHPANNS